MMRAFFRNAAMPILRVVLKKAVRRIENEALIC